MLVIFTIKTFLTLISMQNLSTCFVNAHWECYLYYVFKCYIILYPPWQVWICKPSDLSRGRGIFLFNCVSDLLYDGPTVVQRYIEDPYLIGKVVGNIWTEA